MSAGAGPITFCTILSTNYLPKALALAESLRRHQDGAVLRVLVIDLRRGDELPVRPDGVEVLGTDVLGLAEDELLRLAAIYDLVELATAVKPLLLRALLDASPRAVYLDPDTWVTSPMDELVPALDASDGGLLLTPHVLEPIPAGASVTEGHLLTTGVFNLGFCALDRRALPFLAWWWDHLRSECLFDPLSGLFVDQKWVDIGATLFRGETWRHRGYNVGVGNLHERPLRRRDDGVVLAGEDPLRLFHFHAFDPSTPDRLTTRIAHDADALPPECAQAVALLCQEYAAALTRLQATLPPAPAYRYATDTRGRRVSRQLRRAQRLEDAAGSRPPSPFLPEQAEAYDAWRRRAWRPVSRFLLADAARSARLSFAEEYGRLAQRFPAAAARLRGRFGGGDGIWG